MAHHFNEDFLLPAVSLVFDTVHGFSLIRCEVVIGGSYLDMLSTLLVSFLSKSVKWRIRARCCDSTYALDNHQIPRISPTRWYFRTWMGSFMLNIMLGLQLSCMYTLCQIMTRTSWTTRHPCYRGILKWWDLDITRQWSHLQHTYCHIWFSPQLSLLIGKPSSNINQK